MKKMSVVTHTVSVRLFGYGMDHLHYISIFEEQFAGWATSVLPFQETCDLNGTSGCLPNLVLQ